MILHLRRDSIMLLAVDWGVTSCYLKFAIPCGLQVESRMTLRPCSMQDYSRCLVQSMSLLQRRKLLKQQMPSSSDQDGKIVQSVS